MEVVKGQLVSSRQGRDTERVYVVVGSEGERLLLCDGDKRTLEKPKKKNRLHLNPTGTVLPDSEIETDLKIKMALKRYHKRTGQHGQGG